MNIVESIDLHNSLETFSIRIVWQLRAVKDILILNTTKGKKNVVHLQKRYQHENNAVQYNLLHEVSFPDQDEKPLHLSQNKKDWQYTLFLLYINNLPDHVICDIAIFADDTTLYSKCDQASGLWQQQPSELESDPRDTADWGRTWLVDFNAGKTQLVLFDWSNSTGAIDVKMNGSFLEKKLSFKMLGLTFSSKLDWGSYIISIAKTASRKINFLKEVYSIFW